MLLFINNSKTILQFFPVNIITYNIQMICSYMSLSLISITRKIVRKNVKKKQYCIDLPKSFLNIQYLVSRNVIEIINQNVNIALHTSYSKILLLLYATLLKQRQQNIIATSFSFHCSLHLSVIFKKQRGPFFQAHSLEKSSFYPEYHGTSSDIRVF